MDASERIRLEEIRDDVVALLQDNAEPLPAIPTNVPKPWFVAAHAELGVSEIRGREHNPRVVEYHSSTGLSADDDETPWCSSFVNFCFEDIGMVGTNSARARSWLDWGRAIDEPEVGCVVVFSRPPKPASGHVAFYVGPGAVGKLQVLGGNQGNAVSIKAYPLDRVLGYRMPA